MLRDLAPKIGMMVGGIVVIIVGVLLIPILASSVDSGRTALTTSTTTHTQVISLLNILPLLFAVGLILFGVGSFVAGGISTYRSVRGGMGM